RVSNAMAGEFNRRNDQSLASLRELRGQPEWKQLMDGSPAFQELSEESEAQLASIPKWSSMLVPALLALESLAAMGLGWALFHRMSNVAIGPQLGKLRDFRFNDQLVWGVAVGASIFLLPAFQEGRNAGLNLLLFFRALYALRGMGIMAWLSRTPVMSFLLVAFGVFLWPFAAPLAFGL